MLCLELGRLATRPSYAVAPSISPEATASAARGGNFKFLKNLTRTRRTVTRKHNLVNQSCQWVMRVGLVASLYTWEVKQTPTTGKVTWDTFSAHMLLLRVIEHRQEPALADAATEDLGAAFDALDGALAH